jgi:hypothetical protein
MFNPRQREDSDAARREIQALTTGFEKAALSADSASPAAHRASLAPTLLGQSGLASYAHSFGIDITELRPGAVKALLWARYFEDIVKKIKIPIAQEERRENTFVRVEREVDEDIPKTTYEKRETLSSIPTDNYTLGQLLDASRLPSMVRSEWLKEEVDPTLFMRQLTTGGLMEQQWMENTEQPKESFETVKVKKLFVEPAPPIVHRPHAYVLLDVSGSIRDREAVSKGLGLAYLKYAHEQRAQMYLRKFDDSVGPALTGIQLQELRRIALDIFKPQGGGGTEIEEALRCAVRDIRQTGSTTPGDILLITDGLSSLTDNPLINLKNPAKNVLLHTILLTDQGTEWGQEEAQALATLKSWSSSLFEIHENDSSYLKTPITKEDVEEVSKSLRKLQEELHEFFQELHEEKLTATEVDSRSATLAKQLTNLIDVEDLLLQKLRNDPSLSGRMEDLKRSSQESLDRLQELRAAQNLPKDVSAAPMPVPAVIQDAAPPENSIEEITIPPKQAQRKTEPPPDPWEKAAELDKVSFWEWLNSGIRSIFDTFSRWRSR